ncbi:39S ribosomal protein L55, mitochondrial [Heterocephalus glaber]|uniref:39S ribosomal protein L55, mitochondrial n=1 Tax=Heterocephalus glaber TaxID=10181 RepID=G5C999_HETGA|nr:39S ribosomal protein L55, mitochondrial [Heterocephalus glaber]
MAASGSLLGWADSTRAAFTRLHRQAYPRLYPVLLVKQDGSTIHIRYREPRRMLAMPLDLDTLSPEERRARFRKREAQLHKKQEEPELTDDFDTERYRRFWTGTENTESHKKSKKEKKKKKKKKHKKQKKRKDKEHRREADASSSPSPDRGRSGDMVGTVGEAHHTDSRTEAVMPETAAELLDPTAPAAPSWDLAHHWALGGPGPVDPE